MKLTNKYNLPESFRLAIEAKNQDYLNSHTERSDISVTSLIKPVKMRKLYKDHSHEIEEDVSDMIWSLFGSAVHNVLQASDNELTEERLTIEVDGYKISGQFDRFVKKNGILQDYKTTKVWSHVFGVNPDYEAQVNIYAYMLNKSGREVKKIELVSVFFDWAKQKVGQDNYPHCPVVVTDIDMWSEEKTLAYIRERLEAHFSHDIPDCTNEERWSRDESYAVMKRGRKSALKLFKTADGVGEHEAAQMCKELGAGHYIEYRKPVYKRCEYCNVSKFCDQVEQ